MRTKQGNSRADDLAKIHMGAKDLGLIDGKDRSVYEDMLWTVARVRSAKDLDEHGRNAVLQHLHASGWKGKPGKSTVEKSRDRQQVVLIRKLWALLAAASVVRDASESALRAYCKRYSAPYTRDRAGAHAPELLSVPVASRLIEHLKKWCQRTNVEY